MQLTADTSRPAGARPGPYSAVVGYFCWRRCVSRGYSVVSLGIVVVAVRSFAAVSSLSSLQMMVVCPDVTASTTFSYLLPFFHFAQLVPRPRSAGSNFSPPNLSMNFCTSATSLKQ